MRYIVFLILICVGCSGAPRDGEGGEGGKGGSSLATSSGVGGADSTNTNSSTTTTSTTSTTTTTEPDYCGSAGRAWNCGPSYPDPLASYDPAAEPLDFVFLPAPGEAPDGAVAGRIDGAVGTVTAVTVRLSTAFGAKIPPALDLAVLPAAECGHTPPDGGYQTVTLSDCTQSSTGTVTEITCPILPVDISGPAWIKLRLSEYTLALPVWPTIAADDEPRASWLGLRDPECDGTNSQYLGWEDIRYPSAVGVSTAPVDFGFSLSLAP